MRVASTSIHSSEFRLLTVSEERSDCLTLDARSRHRDQHEETKKLEDKHSKASENECIDFLSIESHFSRFRDTTELVIKAKFSSKSEFHASIT